jgi:hypothetical protein
MSFTTEQQKLPYVKIKYRDNNVANMPEWLCYVYNLILEECGLLGCYAM